MLYNDLYQLLIHSLLKVKAIKSEKLLCSIIKAGTFKILIITLSPHTHARARAF